MAGWRNGSRCGFKIRCPLRREGSTPSPATKWPSGGMEYTPVLETGVLRGMWVQIPPWLHCSCNIMVLYRFAKSDMWIQFPPAAQ